MRGRILWTAVLCVTVGVFAARGENSTDKCEYKWRFQKGQRYVLKNTVERTVTRTMSGLASPSARTEAGKTETTEQMTRFEYNFDVQDIEQDGSAWVSYAYKNASVRVKSPGTDVKFDSTKDRDVPPQALLLVLILGESYYFKMTPKGRVERINGLDIVLTNMKTKAAGIAGRDKIVESLKRQLDEQTIRKELERVLAIYPQGAVGIGDSWSRSEISFEGAGMVVENTFRLKERKDGTGVIDVNVVIKPNPQPQPVQMGEMTARWEASGRGQGLIEVDEITGRIIRGQVTSSWIEEARVISAGVMRRPEAPVASSKTQVVTTFEMSERKDESPGQAGSTSSGQASSPQAGQSRTSSPDVNK